MSKTLQEHRTKLNTIKNKTEAPTVSSRGRQQLYDYLVPAVVPSGKWQCIAGPSHLFCCCSIHLELCTCWHSTVRKHSHFQTSLENPSIQTHL